MEVVTKSPNWTTESWTKTDDEPIRTKPDKNSPKKDHQPLRPVGVVKPNMAEIPSANQETPEDAMAVTEKSPKSSLPAVMDEIKKAEDNDINDVKGMVLKFFFARGYTFKGRTHYWVESQTITILFISMRKIINSTHYP